MKTIVEWGKPASVAGQPCGIFGQFVAESAKRADELAHQLCHVLSNGRAREETCFRVNRKNPRLTYWAADRGFWITVSLLDGVDRGPYYATADRATQRLED